MSHIVTLGAVNKVTGEYVYPKIANKKDTYYCPECDKELILCQGDIRAHYFRHKVDSVNPCHHYGNPSESQIHKDAKLLLKNLIERKVPISFIRSCCCCKKNDEFEIPEINETSLIKLEYRFEYSGTKIADVAYIENGEVLCIFEICNTHKTSDESRPEPWFEINATTLIDMVNSSTLILQIPCIRCEKCDDCIATEKNDLIMRVRADNAIKEQELQIKLDQANESNSKNENYWNPKDGIDTWQYACPLQNIRNNLEIKLIESDIQYNNDNNIYFEVRDISIHSINTFSVNSIRYELIWPELIEWYNNSIKFTTIKCCIDSSNSIQRLEKILNLRDDTAIYSVTQIMNTLDKNSALCKPYFGVDFSFKSKIAPHILLECKLIQKGIEYSIQHTAGKNIYKIQLPGKNEFIKYSCASRKIYMNKSWQTGIDLDSLLFGYIYLNIPYSDKETIKECGGKWNNVKKLWYVSNNNEKLKFILSRWRVKTCD